MKTDPDDTVQSYCVLLFRKSQLNLLETLATTRVTPVLHRARFVSIAVFTESTASVKCERWRQENDPTTAEPASSRPEVCRTASYWCARASGAVFAIAQAIACTANHHDSATHVGSCKIIHRYE
jgi:hypothetical protein